ncbi:MAG: carboxypeptidase-like regulatory domain-containing protein [Acidobacteriota bacterium]|nr:carboxypeptidase-like regulatory domain-containing protein [Acidobacteriota bacterium]
MIRPTSSGRGTLTALLCSLLLCLLAAVAASSQTGSSTTVRGTVTDQQGNVVTGANVTLSNPETNFARTQTTNDSGAFVFDLIPPGTYRVEVEAKGFKKSVTTDVRALIAKPTEINVALEVGTVTEAVTVSANTSEVLLNTQDATLGNNFVSQQITQLPLEARNPISLLTLQPGVTRQGNVTGARSDQSNITLDGVDINEAQTNSITDPVLRLNSEAVEEFRVVTTNANAAQGRSSGAQISLITKSGTNKFHGALFENHRNTIFTANDFFNNRSGIARPKLLRNTFGGALGGPIKHDRFFFFYSYEGRRDASQAAVTARTVPLPSLGRGEVKFVGCPPGVSPCTSANSQVITLNAAQLNALFPTVGLNPVALSVLAGAASRYPANSRGGDGLNSGGFIFNASTPVRFNSHQLRLDYNLTKNGKQQIFFRGSYQNDTQPTSFTNPQQFPDTPLRQRWYHPYGYVMGHTWVVNNHTTNTFRYGLTRLALSDLGDLGANDIFFRFVYTPTTESFSTTRVNPVHNFTDDLSWIKGNHATQFGTNIRIIRNRRTEFGAAFDQALTNPLFYQSSGNVLITPITGAGYTVTSNADDLKAALAAVIGRFSQYTARFNFDLTGQPLKAGSPVFRNWATEEYDVYGQDTWKVRQNLTVTYGLRYGLGKPVYEKQGYMAAPNIPLGEYLRRRIEAASQGINYTEPIIVNKTDHLYNWDKNNFQPRIGVAWSPDFGKNWFGRLIGRHGDSVLRGGFAITNDYFGEQLAVTFNSQNQLGFSSAQTTSANSFNVTTRPAPLFTGLGQDVRGLPLITVPGALTFPQQRSSNNSRRIESSLDSTLTTPVNYSWNFSYERKLPKGLVVEAAYVGRAARNLLAGRDAVQPNLNFTDTKSGQNWMQAATILEIARAAGTPVSQIGPQPFFENLYTPGTLGCALIGGAGCASLTNTQAVYLDALNFNGNDWTTTQDDLDAFSGHRYFYQPQYGALAVYSTIASSDYHAGTLSVRERFKDTLVMDFNYTLSKSMDDVSGLQTDAPFTPFILNALSLKQQRSVSDFDVRHIVNANAIYQLPFGHGRPLLSDAHGVTEALLGGWQLSGIFRWNSGLPVETPLDFGGWPTNWNRRDYTVRIAPIESSPTRGSGTQPANLFSNPAAAYHSFRSSRPGERGDRNVLRYPGFITLDMGLYKSWGMPWSENHKLQLRWDVFNVTNTQRLTAVDAFVQGLDPFKSNKTPTANFGNFTAIQGTPRVMQFGLRYSF